MNRGRYLWDFSRRSLIGLRKVCKVSAVVQNFHFLRRDWLVCPIRRLADASHLHSGLPRPSWESLYLHHQEEETPLATKTYNSLYNLCHYPSFCPKHGIFLLTPHSPWMGQCNTCRSNVKTTKSLNKKFGLPDSVSMAIITKYWLLAEHESVLFSPSR